MTHAWDEFSKLLAEPVPRRESLCRIGFALAGVVLSPLGLNTAYAGRRDPCKSFCKCSKKQQQNACLATCRACNRETSRVCGACGSYSCAGGGDSHNCGACGHDCGPPRLNEVVTCVAGRCVYECVNWTARCGEVCTNLDRDHYNCGACGNSCGELETCVHGTCRNCDCHGDGVCSDLLDEVNNCGACGVVCPLFYVCSAGECTPGEVSPFP
jgi:hypothetical protein